MAKGTLVSAVLLGFALALHAQAPGQGDLYKIELIGGAKMVAVSQPTKVGQAYVFPAWPDGASTTLPQSAVKRITRLTGPSADTVYRIDLVPSGTVISKDVPVLKGVSMSVERGDTPSGAHGLKWIDGKYWMAVPASNKIFLMEPETGEIVRSIPAPGSTPRTHGMAIDKGSLWVINSDDYAIFKLDPKDGAVQAKIQLSKTDPAPHGLDIDRNGVLWYCDAGTGWICKLV